MKPLFLLLISIITITLFSSFTTGEACNYAGANLNYVKDRTQEALAAEDINLSRFYTYKAIKGIQTSTSRFNDCGCADAKFNVDESLINLKAATKSTSLNGTKILLEEALQQLFDALDDLEQHEMHDAEFSTKEYEVSSETNNVRKTEVEIEAELHLQIDISLEDYEQSINKVIASVDCKNARTFANAIFEKCEKTLLIPNLTERKKYYNLRTKEITEEALSRMGVCEEK